MILTQALPSESYDCLTSPGSRTESSVESTISLSESTNGSPDHRGAAVPKSAKACIPGGATRKFWPRDQASRAIVVRVLGRRLPIDQDPHQDRVANRGGPRRLAAEHIKGP
jgi:hypothetical protein